MTGKEIKVGHLSSKVTSQGEIILDLEAAFVERDDEGLGILIAETLFIVRVGVGVEKVYDEVKVSLNGDFRLEGIRVPQQNPKVDIEIEAHSGEDMVVKTIQLDISDQLAEIKGKKREELEELERREKEERERKKREREQKERERREREFQILRREIEDLRREKNEKEEQSRRERERRESTELEALNYLENLVDNQYETATKVLKFFNLYYSNLQEADVTEKLKELLANRGITRISGAPLIEEVKKLLAKNVTEKQLEVIKQMQEATLQLMPVISSERYVEAFNRYEVMLNHVNVSIIDEDRCTRMAMQKANARDNTSGNKIIKWIIVITEGAKVLKLLPGDNVKKTLEERFEWFGEEYCDKKGTSRIDVRSYVLLQMVGLTRSTPRVIDRYPGSSTILDIYGNRTICGLWHGHSVFISSGLDRSAGKRENFVHFRPSVIVDVPKS